MKVSEVILNSLYDIGYNHLDIIDFDTYYQTYAPIGNDKNSMSAIIFKKDGNMKIFNGTVEQDNKIYTTLTLTQWLRQAKCNMRYYIQYILFLHEISKNTFPEYQEYVNNKLLSLPQKYNKKYEDIRTKLYKSYVLDIDVLGINSIDEISHNPIPQQKMPKQVTKANMEICNPTEYELSLIEQYLELRGLKLAISKNVSAKTIVYFDTYRKPCVEFVYNDDYRKYRVVFEQDKKNRFRSLGKYTDFFYARVSNTPTDTLYIIEGEIEALTVSLYTDQDVVAIHNTNSMPVNYEALVSKYNRIIVKIDKDRYHENYKTFLSIHQNVIVDYKVEHPSNDYNDLHKVGELSSAIVTKINIPKE